jgi:two-component system, NtrC family, response regulator AtoC
MKANNLIFVVDDEPTARALMSKWIQKFGYEVRAFSGGEQCLGALDEGPTAICLDIMMPGLDGIEVLKRIQSIEKELPVIMVTAKDSLELAVKSMKLGAYDYIRKPIDRSRLETSLKKAVEKYTLAKKVNQLQKELGNTYSFHNIIGKTAVMKKVFNQIEKVSNNNINVFIQGESGTGKELVARAIHYQGSRQDGPFEAVNCGAIPENLQESEFFGHEKGAFTGAVRSQAGKIEVADGGTLFLDEVGDMSPSLQVKLLRFLETRTIERVGGRKRISVDVRIISATNKMLKAETETGNFREDLYYRLMVYPINIPCLRDRKEDIAVLVRHFLDKYMKETKKDIRSVDHSTMAALVAYDWPGNVRELENVVQRAMVTSDSDRLEISTLPSEIVDGSSSSGNECFPNEEMAENKEAVNFSSRKVTPLSTMEKMVMLNALNMTQGNLALTAKKLEISRATLYRKIDKYDLRNLSPFLRKNQRIMEVENS